MGIGCLLQFVGNPGVAGKLGITKLTRYPGRLATKRRDQLGVKDGTILLV